MDSPSDEDEKYKSLAFPLITDVESANKILDNILQNQNAVVGVDTEAAVEMSRYGILCLLQVINNYSYYY
jgi:ribonuclease D